ncbi:MAG: DNA polymerase subunit beta [Methanomicrobiales archaeon]|nr:DNA polymerase subunit beta [Methanomicrobiales archaeon]
MRNLIKKPVRLRDFIEDSEGRLYAVSAYDNRERVGCILRYVPDPSGSRQNPEGVRFRKLEFEEAFAYIKREKPEYADIIQRVPYPDIRKILKPEDEIGAISRRNPLVRRLATIFDLPIRTYGCTGSLLCGLENEQSDIDFVVYGRAFFHARELLIYAVNRGRIQPISDEMWDYIYRKRNPEIPPDEFILHEKRKWNRGQIDSVYFDILFTRSYKALNPFPIVRGPACGTRTIEATVTDASLSFDSPAVYQVDHDEISRVLSFSHTYSGQAITGERIEARGVCEEHDGERWLIVGTTRDARGEFIRSLSLLDEAGF